MEEIRIVDRKTGKIQTEKVYGHKALSFLYGNSFLAKWLVSVVSHLPFFSQIYGWFQKTSFSKKKIDPFIEAYGVDRSEFIKQDFDSFNDFFTRKIVPRRAFSPLVFPADGRHLVIPDLSEEPSFFVKGQTFDLSALLGDCFLAEKYKKGSCLISRLCPSDYHRFHFPCSGVPGKPRLINGSLFSVNPWALRPRLSILWENKRYLTEIDTSLFGKMVYLEIGATAVGSVRQTFSPGQQVKEGDEKGYFEFGASCVILLFEPGRVVFAPDLIAYSSSRLETYAQMGQSLTS
jgi:phosphatidylserine decarboxylase